MADYKKPDYWQQKARKEGYPARSVYKLIEIEEKYGIFKNAASSANALHILDLGAAPGSWSLYVLRKIKPAMLAAVDLLPLSREFDKGLFDGGNFFFIQGDITTEDVRSSLLSKGPFTAIISDAAPSTTGSRMVDSARSLDLAETVLSYAESFLPDERPALARGGSFVLKIFQGGESTDLLKRMKSIFKTAKSFKPQACRGESVETYYIGLGRI